MLYILEDDDGPEPPERPEDTPQEKPGRRDGGTTADPAQTVAEERARRQANTRRTRPARARRQARPSPVGDSGTHPTTRPDLQNECSYRLIFGSKGFGKTTYARQAAWARVQAGGSMVWLDTTGQNGDLGHVVQSGDEFSRYVAAQLRARLPVVAVVQLGWRAKPGPIFERIFQLGDVLLVLDDAESYASAQYIDPDLRELISKGRNRRVDILTTVRTPPELHKSLRGNPDAVVSFRQSHPDYAKQLNRAYFQLENGVNILMTLPKFHYLHSDDGKVAAGKVSI